MTKNKGFTYYELLIVIAIMAIMVSFTTIGIGTVSRNNVNRIADDIETSVKAGRNYALTKGTENGWVNFLRYNDNLYCYVGEKFPNGSPLLYNGKFLHNWTKVANSFDSISFEGTELTNGKVASLSFKQSTGELNGIIWPRDSSPALHHNDVEIVITKGNSTARVYVDIFGTISIK